MCLKGLPGERYVFKLGVKELPTSILDPPTPYGNREDAYTGPIQSWPMALIREGADLGDNKTPALGRCFVF